MNKGNRHVIHDKNNLKTLNKYYAPNLEMKQIKTNSNIINCSYCFRK